MRSRTTASLAEFSDRQTRFGERLQYKQDEPLRICAAGESVGVNAQGPSKKPHFNTYQEKRRQTPRTEETFEMKTPVSDIINATKLAPDEKNALEDHAHYLLTSLPLDHTSTPINIAPPGRKVSIATLKDIAKKLSKSHALDEHPIPAMLASVAGISIKERKRHERLKAWVFFACLVLSDRESTVFAACRRVRRLAMDVDRWLLVEVLEFGDDLMSIVDRLGTLRDDYAGDSKDVQSKERKIAALHILLADLLFKRQKRGPGPGGQTLLELPDYNDRLIHCCPDNFVFPDVDGITIVSDRQEATSAGDGVHSESVGNRYLDVGTVADDAYPTFLKRRVRQGRELARIFDMRTTASACAWEGLSPNEVQRALDLSFDAAVSDCRASLWIVLALFLGRKPERFWSIPQQVYGRTGSYGDYWRVTKKRIHLVSYLSLPDFDLDHVDRQLVEPVYNCLLLPIPASLTQSLSKALRSIWDKNVSTDELRSETKQRISQLNSEHNTRLTSNRLAAHLHRDLTQRGECDVVSKRIRGIDPQSNYKQRYEARNQDATQTVYRRYAITLLRSIGREGDWQDSQSKSTLFGSQIKVKDEAIRHLFDDLHQRMTAHKDPAREVIRYHNAYSMYVFQECLRGQLRGWAKRIFYMIRRRK